MYYIRVCIPRLGVCRCRFQECGARSFFFLLLLRPVYITVHSAALCRISLSTQSTLIYTRPNYTPNKKKKHKLNREYKLNLVKQILFMYLKIPIVKPCSLFLSLCLALMLSYLLLYAFCCRVCGRAESLSSSAAPFVV